MRARSATTYGRGAELEQLLAAADRARSGDAATVLVRGEAGVGKTRLVDDAVAALRERGALVVVGHGVDLTEGELPFGVLAETLRDLVRQVGADRVRAHLGADADALASLVPALRSGGRPDADHARILGATADLCESLAADQLVCWLVEDLQWADASTRDTFSYLTRSLRACSLVTVATWRTTDDGAEPPAGAEVVDVGPLAEPDVLALARELDGWLTTSDRLRIAELSQGLPFLIEELVSSWQSGVGVDPTYLRRLVLTRLPALSRAASELVELAAVGAGHLDVRLLEDGLGVDPGAIREAVEAGLLDVVPAGDTLRFRHALLREAIEDATPPGDRRRLHRRWAEAIDADARPFPRAARISALARHWHEAGDAERALPVLAEAARAAARLPAPAAEHAAWARVLASWTQVADPEALVGSTKGRVLVRAANAAFQAGDPDSAEELLLAEQQRAAPGEDPFADAWVALRRGLFAEDFRHRDPGWDAALVATLLDGDVTDPRVLDGIVYAANAAVLGDHEARATALLVELLEATADPEDLAWATIAVAQQQGTVGGRFDEALTTILTQQPRLAGAPLAERWNVAMNRAWYQFLLGHAAEAATYLEDELASISHPSALPGGFSVVAENLAQAQLVLGRWDEALATAARGLEVLPHIYPEAELVLKATYLQMHQCAVHTWRGEADDARRLHDSLAVQLGATPWADRVPQAMLAAVIADVAAADGELDRVRAELDGAWRLRPAPDLAQQVPFAAVVALRAESALVDRHDPAARAGSAAHVARVLAVVGPLPRPGPRGTAWWAEARAHEARSRSADTAADWAPAVAAWRECEQPYDVAVCLHHLGEAALVDGDTRAATEALAEADALCERLGARPLQDAVLATARRGRLPVGPAAPSSGPLTAREAEVLALVAAGGATSRSRPSCTCRPRRSRSTSRGSWPSCTPGTAPRLRRPGGASSWSTEGSGEDDRAAQPQPRHGGEDARGPRTARAGVGAGPRRDGTAALGGDGAGVVGGDAGAGGDRVHRVLLR